MRNYELVMIISPEVTEEDIPGTLDKVSEFVTAKGGAIPKHRNHLDRRLRGYAIYLTPEVLINHQIADHQDVAPIKP